MSTAVESKVRCSVYGAGNTGQLVNCAFFVLQRCDRNRTETPSACGNDQETSRNTRKKTRRRARAPETSPRVIFAAAPEAEKLKTAVSIRDAHRRQLTLSARAPPPLALSAYGRASAAGTRTG